MAPITLLTAIALALIVTRVAAVALMFTGLSREAAKFQAWSAFTGTGFTTHEAEHVVNHPVRRRIVVHLMLLGNVGIATVVTTLLISAMQTVQSGHWAINLTLLFVGISAILFIGTSKFIERHLNALITWSLKAFTNLEVRDYVALLHLHHGFGISELVVRENHWLSGMTLIGLGLSQEGILVLGIEQRDRIWHGSPTGSTVVRSGDTLILYGPLDRIRDLERRSADQTGQRAHREAVREQHAYVENIEETIVRGSDVGAAESTDNPENPNAIERPES